MRGDRLWWIPWILKAAWNPPKYLDLMDEKTGRPDHAKVVGVYAFTVFVGLILLRLLPSVGHTIALLSVVFGWLGWRTFLASRTVTSHEAVTRDDTPPLERGERMPDDERDRD